MRNLTEFKQDLDSILYTKKELEILSGVCNKVSDSTLLKLIDKTLKLNDAENTMRLLGYQR